MLSNYAIAIVRTFVPILVGFAANLIARFGFHVNDAEIATEISTGVPVVYYALVRKAEERWPSVGWLLGKPVVTTYSDVKEETNTPKPVANVTAAPTVAPVQPAPAPVPAPVQPAPAADDTGSLSGD